MFSTYSPTRGPPSPSAPPITPGTKRIFPNAGAQTSPLFPNQQQKINITHNITSAANTTRTGLIATTTSNSYSHCSQNMRYPMSLATPTSIPDKYGPTGIIPFGKIQEGGVGSQRSLDTARERQWIGNNNKLRYRFNTVAAESNLSNQNSTHVKRVIAAKKKIDNSCPRGLKIMEEDGRRECTVGEGGMSAAEHRRVNAYLRRLRTQHHQHRLEMETEDRELKGALKQTERISAEKKEEVSSWGPLYFRNYNNGGQVEKSITTTTKRAKKGKGMVKKKSKSKNQSNNNNSSAVTTTLLASSRMPCTADQFERLVLDLQVDCDPRTTYKRYLAEREHLSMRQTYAQDPFQEHLRAGYESILEEGDEELSKIDEVPFAYRVAKYNGKTFILYEDEDCDDEEEEHVHGDGTEEDVISPHNHLAASPAANRSVRFTTTNTAAVSSSQRPSSAASNTIPFSRRVSSSSTSATPTNTRPTSALSSRSHQSSNNDDVQQRHHHHHQKDSRGQQSRLLAPRGFAAEVFRLERQLERVEMGEPAKLATVKNVYHALYDDAKARATTTSPLSKRDSISSPSRSVNRTKLSRRQQSGEENEDGNDDGGSANNNSAELSAIQNASSVWTTGRDTTTPANGHVTSPAAASGAHYDAFTTRIADMDTEERPESLDPTRVKMHSSWGFGLNASGLSPTTSYASPKHQRPATTPSALRSPLTNRTTSSAAQRTPSSKQTTSTAPTPTYIRHSASYKLQEEEGEEEDHYSNRTTATLIAHPNPDQQQLATYPTSSTSRAAVVRPALLSEIDIQLQAAAPPSPSAGGAAGASPSSTTPHSSIPFAATPTKGSLGFVASLLRQSRSATKQQQRLNRKLSGGDIGTSGSGSDAAAVVGGISSPLLMMASANSSADASGIISVPPQITTTTVNTTTTTTLSPSSPPSTTVPPNKLFVAFGTAPTDAFHDPPSPPPPTSSSSANNNPQQHQSSILKPQRLENMPSSKSNSSNNTPTSPTAVVPAVHLVDRVEADGGDNDGTNPSSSLGIKRVQSEISRSSSNDSSTTSHHAIVPETCRGGTNEEEVEAHHHLQMMTSPHCSPIHKNRI